MRYDSSTPTHRLEGLHRGRALPSGPGEAMVRLLGRPVGREGLSKALQSSFPGARTFAVETRVAPDQSVDFTVVAVARNGEPVYVGRRALSRGRNGCLELHHVDDEVSPEYRSRGILIDTIECEIALLASISPRARITLDAHETGGYLAALHGCVFADETDEGPPARSKRARVRGSDRERILEAAPPIIENAVRRAGGNDLTVAAVMRQLQQFQTPEDLLQLGLQDNEYEVSEAQVGFASGIGRALLLHRDCPAWRGALYANHPADPGPAFRFRQTARSRDKLEKETQDALARLDHKQRAQQIRALRTLGRIAPTSCLPRIKAVQDGDRRGVAAVARRTVEEITGAGLYERVLAFAKDRSHNGAHRGLAFRVLAEYQPALIEELVPMLRVDPDARVQRSVIPLLAEQGTEAGPALASLLAANPWSDRIEARPGLAELRLEIIESLSRVSDPRIIPALMDAVHAAPPPPPMEHVALSRVLVAHPDPRARKALSSATERLDVPSVP